MKLLRRTGWIGVDIGTRTVKLAQVVRYGDRARLLNGIVLQRSHPWSDQDDVALAAPVSSYREIFAALHANTRFSGRNVACVLPMNAYQLRSMTLPSGTASERRAMVAEELASEWADKAQEMTFDYWELDSSSDGSEPSGANVAALATTKQWISQVVSDCDHARLDCWAVDGVPLAMARAVSLVANLGPGARVLALDWGFSNTTLSVVGDRRSLLSRRLRDCSLRQLLEHVRSTLGVSLEQAQYVVDRFGVVKPGEVAAADHEIQSAVTEAAAATLEGLADEIRRTLRYLEIQRQKMRPSALWILGGGASIRNLAEYLEPAIGLPVRIWEIAQEKDTSEARPRFHSALLSNAVALSAMPWRAA